MHFNVVVSGGLFYTFFILVLFMFEFVFIMFKHFLITDLVAYKPFHNVVPVHLSIASLKTIVWPFLVDLSVQCTSNKKLMMKNEKSNLWISICNCNVMYILYFIVYLGVCLLNVG